jgi:hypothetical protein
MFEIPVRAKYMTWTVKQMRGGENAAPKKKRVKDAKAPVQRKRVMVVAAGTGKRQMQDAAR